LVISFFTVAVLASQASGEDSPSPLPGKRSADRARMSTPFNSSGGYVSSNVECNVTATSPNTRLDCDETFPNNEPHIAVDPADPLHMVASSNDYGSCCDQFYTT